MNIEFILLWLAAGCVTAIGIAFLRGCHETKSISYNVMFGMILAIALGGLGLAAAVIILVITTVAHFLATKGDRPLFSWGADDPEN